MLALMAVVALYSGSEWLLGKTRDVSAQTLELVPAAIRSADAAEGERLARVFGCFNGYRGVRADSGVFIDIPNVAYVIHDRERRCRKRFPDWVAV